MEEHQMALSKKDFISIADFSRKELEEIIDLAIEQKALLKKDKLERTHIGRTLACIFHKPSLRTRVSFEIAMHQLGGSSLFITDKEVGIQSRELPKDVARVLSRYVSAIMIRTFDNSLVETLAEWASVPVINGLTDLLHPCQIMADLQTVKEHRGSFDGMTVVFIGDGNNVARSWLNAAAKFDFKFILACPKGFGIETEFVEKTVGGKKHLYEEINDAHAAVKNGDVLYTDVWASMGQETGAEEKKKNFLPFQLNTALLRQAPKDAIVLHCLPAHRGEEITENVIESKQSLVFDEAENRMHSQRALLSLLIPPRGARA
jgi:ornithine carbamoyltransferase